MPLSRLLNVLGLESIGRPGEIRRKYHYFLRVIAKNSRCHELMATLQEMALQRPPPELNKVRAVYNELSSDFLDLITDFKELSPTDHGKLSVLYKKIDNYCRYVLSSSLHNSSPPYCLDTEEMDSGRMGLIGGKAQGIVALIDAGVRVPKSLFVTINAFWRLVDREGIYDRIMDALSTIESSDVASIRQASERIKVLLETIQVPHEILAEIHSRIHGLGPGPYAMRSSACYEDAEFSFAGQYKTVLNCEREDIANAYLEIIKSKYAANAIWYRINAGLSDEETPMGVILMEMICPAVSGVAYTMDPENMDMESLRISFVEGGGDKLVGGRVKPVDLVVPRGSVEKGQMKYGETPFVTIQKMDELVRQVLSIEAYFNGVPQDVEWCISKDGELYILQTRPLLLRSDQGEGDPGFGLEQHHGHIVEGGDIVSPGCVHGKAFVIKGVKDLDRVPFGSILVAVNALPEYSQIIGRIIGIIAEKGAITSHLATVAREFKVPSLFGVKGITGLLSSGDLITLCSSERRIYMGKATHVCERLKKKDEGENPLSLPIYKRINALLSLVVPLGLKDTQDSAFRPEGCRSLHDILRYCHEVAMRSMFGLTRDSISGKYVKRLKLPIPLTIYLLDVDALEGVKTLNEDTNYSLETLENKPLRALLQGLAHPGVDWEEREHFDWQSFDQIALSGVAPISRKTTTFSSFVIASKNYFNLNLKFGYHFTVVDALCSLYPRSNYISVRFAGGGGTETGRMFRLLFIEEVLNEWGFSTRLKGEELWARITGVSESELVEICGRLGNLLGFTKLLDLQLTDESRLKEAFVGFEERFK